MLFRKQQFFLGDPVASIQINFRVLAQDCNENMYETGRCIYGWGSKVKKKKTCD